MVGRVLTLLFLVIVLPSFGQQKQLLLLKRGKLIARFDLGDDIRVKLVDDGRVLSSYINNLYLDAVLVHYDTVYFHKIDRIYTKGKPLSSFTSALLLRGGIGAFLAISVNDALFQRETLDLGSPINITAYSAIGLGILFGAIKRRSYKLGRRFHLLIVDSSSPLYHRTK